MDVRSTADQAGPENALLEVFAVGKEIPGKKGSKKEKK